MRPCLSKWQIMFASISLNITIVDRKHKFEVRPLAHLPSVLTMNGLTQLLRPLIEPTKVTFVVVSVLVKNWFGKA